MLRKFVMNSDLWHVRFTSSQNPILVDRTNILTVGVTDPSTMTVYLSDRLSGGFLTRVTLHELSHAMMYSYGYLHFIHKYCKPEHWVDMEELIANIIADRAKEIFEYAYEIVGDEAIHFVPYHMERLVS